MPHIHEKYDFTVSAYILHPTEPKIVLLFHNKLQKWLQPGGHIELHENPMQALEHEVLEETGLNPSDYTVLQTVDQPVVNSTSIQLPLPFFFNEHSYNETHSHIDLGYLLKAHIAKLTKNPDGASDINWFNLKQIKELVASDKTFKGMDAVAKWIFEKFC